jgi:uncharacterized protein
MPTLPDRAGLGLKPGHVPEILETRPEIGFFEIHAENYMGDGGPPHRALEAVRALYPLSVHGVGLSIGGEGPLDGAHLARLRRLLDRYQPESFSEHLAWSTHEGVYFSDLLPLPYDRVTLARVADHVDEVQERLARRMLLENPSTYLRLPGSEMSELDFLREVVRRTGCGLLLDVNNVHVSATNGAFEALAYLNGFPVGAVGEIHLGGFAEDTDGEAPLLIDAHGTPVAAEVWGLYARAIERAGPMPTLIEWDNDVPDFATLRREAARAELHLRRARGLPRAVRA